MRTIPAPSALVGWRKSSYSNGEGAACIEVADGTPDAVLVRDSKNPTGPTLAFRADEWACFLTAVKSREFAS
ncbi:DUF397 domain-containing protein [Streptomyces hygroscopicus]|uniref:DUF397 domain-containing protein n=1 Tax=Streptomyces hygroscopicus TaxID=1912 RepID=UPI001FCB773D|nr:DUF397 domain-containing protein [Streptomyces hygroscopicus]BDH15632.1 hypothetical protein HOK021_68110 [Streptomyces hygroscopicus]